MAAVSAVALFGLAAAVGAGLGLAGHPVHASAAPLFAHPLAHAGPGTPAALITAGLVIWHGPALAQRLPWRRLLGLAYAAALAWTFSLALVDGWGRGLAGRLTTGPEYLSEVPGVTDIPAMLRGFTGRILDGQPDSWTTHVSGHPPGALLVFVALDRLGLGGGGWAAVLCVLVGASAAVTVPLTVRALGPVGAGRAVVPFMVLFPGAVWVGASADGLFTGVTAAGVALLVAGRGRAGPAAVLGGGVLLGAACFLSYGLVLMAPVGLAALVVAGRWRLAPVAALGAGAVFAAFAVAGFWWPDGYHLVVRRYYQGIASDRPYSYWVWANLACLVACAGPAAAPVLRRCVAGTLGRLAAPLRRATAIGAGPPPPGRAWRSSPGHGPGATGLRSGGPARWPVEVLRGVRGRAPWQLLPVAAATAIVLADSSGLSKAEVERIWLPFAVWLLAGAGALPAANRRGWLVVQAATALAINHLLLTGW